MTRSPLVLWHTVTLTILIFFPFAPGNKVVFLGNVGRGTFEMLSRVSFGVGCNCLHLSVGSPGGRWDGCVLVRKHCHPLAVTLALIHTPSYSALHFTYSIS
jgi:hypothetical protein